jgi:hypothetical protein
MRITARNPGICPISLAILSALAGPLGGQSPAPAVGAWMPALAKLASSLSQNDAAGALEVFDSGMDAYGTIEANVGALAAQTDILCAIDVVEDKDDNGIQLLDVDWFMQLKSRADGGPTERRRQRVRLQMKQIRGKWKIISILPIGILDPIHIN